MTALIVRFELPNKVPVASNQMHANPFWDHGKLWFLQSFRLNRVYL